MTSRWVLVYVWLVLSAACGGGGSSGVGLGTGIGGSGGGAGAPPGVVVGTFQGQGSIIVNDRTLSTAGATFDLEDGGGETDLREGQQLTVFADLATNEAQRVIYRSDVEGPLTSVSITDPLTGAAQLEVLGQTVRTNALTRFDGATLATLMVGDFVEISGTRDAAGTLTATYVGRLANLTEFELEGIVANLDANNQTFALGALTVDYSSATLSDFQGAALANGQYVEVEIDVSGVQSAATVVATEVELLTELELEVDSDVELEGFIDRFASAADFDVSGFAVSTTSNTVFVNGDAGSLGLNVKVEVEGQVDAGGVLVAQRVVFKPTGAVRVEGTVSAIDESLGTVSTEVGLVFTIRALTELEDDRDGVEPFTLADLQIGDYVEVRGFLDGQTLVAAELERDDFDTQTALRGPVTAEDETAGTVDILDVRVTGVAGVTNYDTTQAQFHAEVELGSFVEASWDPFVDTQQTADELSVEDDD